ncbi:Serine carboxypeptidase-like protein [Triticum urartu]|uniref:Carboxypeptidase n=1 Tax=Triticum urartu TaxID=4572 RepID=M7ZB28_TRIUA|nr:Serine carboxypeptidase-like protein [Triticum urartu]
MALLASPHLVFPAQPSVSSSQRSMSLLSSALRRQQQAEADERRQNDPTRAELGTHYEMTGSLDSSKTQARGRRTPSCSREVKRCLRLSLTGGPIIVAETGQKDLVAVSLPHFRQFRLFYFFFESRRHKEDPVVIWLTGGPGCSSELALFYENGPFNIADNMSLLWNEFGWDQESNLIYVDQPTGTGFSYSSDSRDTRHNEATVSNDLYDFLQAFFKEHPEYVENDFYITGESYAGHYIPAFATRVYKGNKNNEGIHINLKGFAIGNGLTDPAIQYKAYTDYALDMGLITQSEFTKINKIVPACEFAVKLCGTSGTVSCFAAYFVCNTIFSSIRLIIGNKNYYDVRKPCVGSLCYDFSNLEKFLNLKSVRQSLGVGDIEFVSCSPTVYQAMLLDWMRNLEVGIPELLENDIKVLIYAGEYDLICNWLGNSRWVDSMEWSGKKAFVSSAEKPFTVDGKEAGVLKSHGPLSFLKVHDSGHMVPMDQPKAALEMLKRWMSGNLSDASSSSQRLDFAI